MEVSPGATPFADVRRLFDQMPGPDEAAVRAVRARDRELTKPPGSLGRLEWLVEWLAAWQGKPIPTVDRPLVCVFSASHGVAARGVSAYPPEVNRQMLENFAAGGAAINQICTTYNLGFKAFDLALDMPTADIVDDAAMDERACVATMAFGMEAIAGGTDILAVGEMGIGNTTIAAAIYAALYGGAPATWVGLGSGVDEAGYARKVATVRAALARHEGSAIRSRCCAVSAAAMSRQSPALSSPRAWSAFQWCSTAMSRPPRRRSSMRSTRRPSTIASPGTFLAKGPTRRCSSVSARFRCWPSACVSARPLARRWRLG